MLHNDCLYRPYGAYALKATYQRNMILSNLIVISLILIILIGSRIWCDQSNKESVVYNPRVIRTVAELGPPPAIRKRPPQVKVNAPGVSVSKVGIPKPVADDEVLEDNIIIASRDELAEIITPPVIGDGDAGEIVVDIADEEFDYVPRVDEFVPVEILPEMIYHVQPTYNKLIMQAGIEGSVWIAALVYKDGTVKDAVVAKSSGVATLDEAAVQAAYRNKYKPGVQNGRPVSAWVTYKVEFVLVS